MLFGGGILVVDVTGSQVEICLNGEATRVTSGIRSNIRANRSNSARSSTVTVAIVSMEPLRRR